MNRRVVVSMFVVVMGVAGLHTVVAHAAGAQTISTAHVEITTTTSPETATAGSRVALALNVVPHRGLRVYASGAVGYKAVALTLTPQPFLRLRPARYDPSEIYFFETLNERVPVYQRPFSVHQDVMILATAEGQAALRGKDSLTLTGMLDYQACDDQVCFIPVSVPVSWTVAIRPLVKPRRSTARN